ncbi:hypothetical protein [Devosia faecipullorum]|uniref:hypothetical protein n=1 Tax=Devosia faecipullorum TaxID=2755039 RepID=UPI00187B7CB5|nr:hypothetical protein [Devosia faecipullorum]MBE7732296.1 hypothetical protein [Devosia faecipullorum]
MDLALSQELFPHVRVVMGTVIGLGITRLLMTVAGIIQHPMRGKVSALHMFWVGSMLLELILFWWWEFALRSFQFWSFGVVLFLMIYAITLFLMAALLSPDNISEYKGYEDFFLKRRNWFFGLLATTFLLDLVDTMIKGEAHWTRFDWTYFAQVPIGLLLCIIAWKSRDRRVHLIIVGLHLLHQLALVLNFFTPVP